MKKGKNSPERLIEQLVKLEPVEFLGICKILGIELYKEDNSEEDNTNKKEKDFDEIWSEVCDKITTLNRVRRRNLGTLIYSATKKR